jgi:hypothetical protein
VADSPADGAIPLDATVGSLDQLEVAAPFASAADVPVGVSITGDAVSDAAAMGLAEDLSLLVQGFMRRPASAARERSRTEAQRVSGHDVDIQIALHGLQASIPCSIRVGPPDRARTDMDTRSRGMGS